MRSVRQQQQGFVSIIVTMIIIALVSLIALGFAFLARQNQRQTTDRRLSAQAFYAAESGVNDATSAIKSGSLTGDVTTCGAFAGNELDANNKYTCVLVTQAPTSLVYDSISQDNSTIVRVRTSENVANLRISWQDAGSGNQFAASGGKFYLPQEKAIKGNATSPYLTGGPGAQTAAFPNHTGMLRTTIIPASAANSTDNLLNNSQTVYLYPDGNASASNSGNVAFRTGGNLASEGVFGSGQCNTGNTVATTPNFPRFCNTNITGINSNDFYIRLRAIYRPVAVTITATGASSSNPLSVTGAQAVVDSTGKSLDTLRRIQVRVPLSPSYYFPEFAIESANTICKRFTAWGGGAMVDPAPPYLYNSSHPFSGGESNDQAKDVESCRLPSAGNPT